MNPLLLLPFLVIFPQEATAEPTLSEGVAAHACVPAAACLVLKYFGEDVKYDDIYAECDVTFDGASPLSDLVDAVESRGLQASVYQNVSFTQLRSWLDDGYAVVAIPTARGKNHALTMLGSELFVADMLEPLHKADNDKLASFLNEGMICAVIGREEPRQIRWWISALVLFAVLGLMITSFGKGQKSTNS